MAHRFSFILLKYFYTLSHLCASAGLFQMTSCCTCTMTIKASIYIDKDATAFSAQHSYLLLLLLLCY